MGSTTDKSSTLAATPPPALVFAPVTAPDASKEVRLPMAYGSFYARYWHCPYGWLGFVDYHLGDDIAIHRGSPFALGMDEASIVAWITDCFDEGPGFIVGLVEEVSNG